MAKGSRGRRRIASRQCWATPYTLPCNHDKKEGMCPKKGPSKKDWEDATCSVCMEFPHNAVLLLCSSHDNGCRPYMCGTSLRYSNCLDQYKKAYTKVMSLSHNNALPSQGSVPSPPELPDLSSLVENQEAVELACPLCRGQVKGWTVVESAREFLNMKERSCMQESCPFVGNYKELRKHVKAKHPSARPREVDPALEQKWRRLERERERDDVISTIRSSMPGAMVFGDYVVEGNNEDDEALDAEATDRNRGSEAGFDNSLLNVFLLLHAFGQSGNIDFRRLGQSGRSFGHGAVGAHQASPAVDLAPSDDDDDDDDDDDSEDDAYNSDNNMSLVNRLSQHGRVLLGRSGRRRRRREANGGQIIEMT